MSKPLIILGTSGLAREMAQVVRKVNEQTHAWDFRGFVGVDTGETGKDLGFGRVLGDDAWLLAQDEPFDLVVGIGYPKIRARALQPYLTAGERFSFPNLIHPQATLDLDQVAMGQGNVLTVGTVFTCNVGIGDFNLFNWNVTVGHDTRVGSYNVINPGSNISGFVELGDRILVGTGCQVLETRKVGSDATLGAGSLVREDVEAGVTVVGVPAKPRPAR